MKNITKYSLGASLVLSLSLASCTALKTDSSTEPAAVTEDKPIAQEKNILGLTQNDIDRMSDNEQGAVYYLLILNEFNVQCAALSAKQISVAQATNAINQLTKLLWEVDSTFYDNGSSPVWAIITGPRYEDYHIALKEKVGDYTNKLGGYINPEYIERSTPLGRAMYEFGCIMYHAG